MNDTELKEAVAQNIVGYRKALKLTQAELADKLNYSDKAVSKWERAEALPDIFVLKQIADLFGITLDELATKPEKAAKFRVQHRAFQAKILVPMLSAGIAWLAATVAFSILTFFNVWTAHSWWVFLFAVPVSFIVLLVFSIIWWDPTFTFLFVSALIWAVALVLFVVVPGIDGKIPGQFNFLFFIVAIPLQVLEVLWAIFKKPPRKN
ncbi:MAG: helix-turn-helix transcriptional regulator [Firmicutes bacterium]|nr:helix-turn-helix transcriptional regulator [Bacillota bacterium]